MFWLKKILLLVDSLHSCSKQETTFQSHLTDTGFERAKNVLENAIVTILKLMETKKNCTHHGLYIKARLLSRLGLILYTESKEMKYKSASDKEQLLHRACTYLEESFKELSDLGYKSESIEMMFVQVEIQKKIAHDRDDEQAKETNVNRDVRYGSFGCNKYHTCCSRDN